MRLSDIMGGLDLSVYPQAALLIFLSVFVGVMLRVFWRPSRAGYAHAASLPLDDGGCATMCGREGAES